MAPLILLLLRFPQRLVRIVWVGISLRLARPFEHVELSPLEHTDAHPGNRSSAAEQRIWLPIVNHHHLQNKRLAENRFG